MESKLDVFTQIVAVKTDAKDFVQHPPKAIEWHTNSITRVPHADTFDFAIRQGILPSKSGCGLNVPANPKSTKKPHQNVTLAPVIPPVGFVSFFHTLFHIARTTILWLAVRHFLPGKDASFCDESAQRAYGESAATKTEKVNIITGRIVFHYKFIQLPDVPAQAPSECPAENLPQLEIFRADAIVIKGQLLLQLRILLMAMNID